MTNKRGNAATQKTARHTSGPWILDVRSGCLAVYPADRANDTPGCHFDDDRNIHFSTKGAVHDEAGWTIPEETIINARFIVAACNAAMKANPGNPIAVAEALPDLLEAGQQLVEHLTKMENGKWLNNAPGEELKAAIAKATGKDMAGYKT